jgi:hypothetical protein
MAELDFRERERQGREQLAERLKRLRARLALAGGSRPRPVRREAPKEAESEQPTWWWQRD